MKPPFFLPPPSYGDATWAEHVICCTIATQMTNSRQSADLPMGIANRAFTDSLSMLQELQTHDTAPDKEKQ